MLNNRRAGREAALQALYQMDSLGEWGESNIDLFFRNFYDINTDTAGDNEVYQFSRQITEGVLKEKSKIDTLMQQAAENWTLERMSRTDRNLLRVAAYELLYFQDVPVSVVINEALEIAKRFSTESSLTFINGVLDKIAKIRPVKARSPVEASGQS